jgi:RNA polymerase sigma-70 factor (ECF subfamily)
VTGPEAIDRVFREESGQVVASLTRIIGDLELAEDAVQEAFATALRRWPKEGLPPNPGGWITTTARHKAIDVLRRDARGRELLAHVLETPVESATGVLRDDRLRLIFTCCHPALAPEAQIALTLRLVCGLPTAEIARAFLVTETTMSRRLTRAKRKISAARIPYRVPEEHELPGRLRQVLLASYLVYNSGAADEGIRLARLLRTLLSDEPEVAGLLALMLLTESRRASRLRDGALVLLRDQDRTTWDRPLIDEGHALVRECLWRDEPGDYQLQAAINAVHADAPSYQETDWRQIVALYDLLLAVTPTAVVALNRAIAVGEVKGPQAALDLVEPLQLQQYFPWHAARADFLRRLNREGEARLAYAQATALAPPGPEKRFLGEMDNQEPQF